MNQLFKFFNKKAKETDQQEEGLKIYLDFELKTFKFLPVDDFSNSEHISLMIIEELLKGGQPIFIYGQEVVKIADFPFKRYSSLYLIPIIDHGVNLFPKFVDISKCYCYYFCCYIRSLLFSES